MQEDKKSNIPVSELSLGAGLLGVTFGLYTMYKYRASSSNEKTSTHHRPSQSKDDKIEDNNKSDSKVTLYFTTLNEQSRSIWHYCLLYDVDVAVDLLEYNTETLEKVNPFKNGIILKDGDFFLTEAPAIARYLSEKENKVDEWFGDNKETRSLVDQYMSWHQRNLGFCSQLWKNKIQENLKENGDSTLLTNEGSEKLVSSLEVIENIFLKDSPFLCGARPTFADILACHQIWQLTEFQGIFEIKMGEKTKAWLEKLHKMLFTDQVLAELREFAESEKVVSLRRNLELCDKFALTSIKELKFYQSGILNKNCIYRPVVVCGPSGTGKSTLISMITKKFPGVFTFSVSHTTRQKREKETDGVDYHFVSREEFLKLKDQNIFIENAEYSGNFYGTSYTTLQDAKKNGKICLLDIDLQGVQTIKKVWNKEYGPMPAFIQVVPPNFPELKRRLVGRGDTSQEAIQKRLEIAKKELEFTHVPDFFDHVIINEDKDFAYLKLAQAINQSQLI